MIKQLFSVVPYLFIFTILFLPLVMIDIFIINIMDGYYTKLIYLIIFLIIFYIIDLVLSMLIENMLKVINDFNFIKINIRKTFTSVFFDFLGSLIVIIFLDSIFSTVNLTMAIQVLISFVHTLLIILINNLQTEKSEKTEVVSLPEPIEYEIKKILQKENMITCINLIKEKYPHIPKSTIIKSVRKINKELNH